MASMKLIRLSNSRRRAMVDDRDYSRVSKHNWSLNVRDGCAQACNSRIGRKSMHRFIMGAKRGIQIDHRDLNRLNNRRKNLRRATNQQNCRNKKKLRRNGKCSSRYKGVCWHQASGSWVARIRILDKRIHLGCFKTQIAAARAYNKSAKRHFGKFAFLNSL